MIDPIMSASTSPLAWFSAPSGEEGQTSANPTSDDSNVSYMFNPIAPSEEAYQASLNEDGELPENAPWLMSPSEGAAFMARLAEMAEAAGEGYRHPGMTEISAEKLEPSKTPDWSAELLNQPI